MQTVLLIHEIIVALIVISGFWIVAQVYFTDRRSKINRLFCLIVCSVLVWIIASFLGNMVLKNDVQAVFAVKLNWIAVSLFFIVMYFFSLYFPKESERNPLLDKITIIIWSALGLITIFTDLIIKKVIIGEFGQWGSNVTYGKGEGIFFLAVIFWTILILFNIFKKYFILPAEEKIKAQYFVIGIFLFALFNLIFNVIFPLIRGNTQYYQLGDYSAAFIIFFTWLAVVKKGLFGIKVIVVDSLVGIIAIVLFIFPFLLDIFILKIIGWSIFGFFSIIGYLLIKFIHQEVKTKEILEQRVRERTKELEEKKDESEKRAAELERWYKLTVGRELKMVELKKKIKELEEEVEEK